MYTILDETGKDAVLTKHANGERSGSAKTINHMRGLAVKASCDPRKKLRKSERSGLRLAYDITEGTPATVAGGPTTEKGNDEKNTN